MNRRPAVAAAALCLLATIAATAPATAVGTDPAAATATATAATDGTGPVRLHGSGGTVLTAAFHGFEGDPVRFELDARAGVNADPGTTSGHFHVTHVHTDGRLVADFEGDITCLAVGGREAIATGVVTKGEAPWFPGRPLIGQQVALSVEDDGRRGDRLGWVWGMFGAPVSDCQGTVPFIRTTGGDFTVRG
ncbi:hypothetical protein ACIPLC_17525 [Kitasatospora sp. NPDC086801]|uniref:hypothetical protein n=1 Tax=Kitasatospora sp. NPDC086801 TaxID=3364066 RepID=UPI00382B932A